MYREYPSGGATPGIFGLNRPFVELLFSIFHNFAEILFPNMFTISNSHGAAHAMLEINLKPCPGVDEPTVLQEVLAMGRLNDPKKSDDIIHNAEAEHRFWNQVQSVMEPNMQQEQPTTSNTTSVLEQNASVSSWAPPTANRVQIIDNQWQA